MLNLNFYLNLVEILHSCNGNGSSITFIRRHVGVDDMSFR